MKEEKQPGDQKEHSAEEKRREESLAEEMSEGEAISETAEEAVERNYGEQPRSRRKQRKRVRALSGIIAVRDLLRMVLLLVFLIASLITDKTGVCELAMILR
ncbi:hypothetical protein BH24ACT21_BH24ACT21_05200 [soil metagenome]